ncbi:uncharacterized protein LOC127806635 [Diospyros lotus]|uniref:uncharacterized protein LOC127806635 n=1 Tax=Diospyros lotus TaxID=55363 RepID=UPI00224CE9E4|nr:uncharacterized protein LOC127806635 [Diospyros lotus]
MADFIEQLEEIKTLLSSNAKANRPFAYSSLLHLQEQSSSSADPSLIHSLANASRSLLSSILADVSDDDEEIAAQALKCLGFTIYHPTLVAAISAADAYRILASLAEVIITTKMKSVCNLGAWCISIQQLDAVYLSANLHSLLRAVVHAIDNPSGSMSTSFEAIQALMKLATQLNENMKETSNIWAPTLYRRLISNDKRLRDMSERCLLKIKSIICPPPLNLSKALAIDIKKKLLPGIRELLNCGLKIQAIKAWGWLICLLGPYAMKNRHLINEMLKVPEQTFSDADPQVQIATLVAWEGLIDTLIQPPEGASEINMMAEHSLEHGGIREGKTSGIEREGFSKSVKLIMTPILGIMSSKCEISVHSSCLNTWCYLLHKLDTSINCSSVIRTVWEPIFETVFCVKPDSKSIGLWIICLDLLDEFILTRNRDVNDDLNNPENRQLLAKPPTIGPPISGEWLWKHYPVKWWPWDLNKLAFCIKMIRVLLSQGSMVTVPAEEKSLACNAAFRVFRSVLKGVSGVFKNSSTTYDEVMCCFNGILGLVKGIYANINPEHNGTNDLLCTCLEFVEVMIQELEPSILESPLYKVPLDLNYIEHLQAVNESNLADLFAVRSIAYLDMVSPIEYLTILAFCGLFNSSLDAPGSEFILQGACRVFKLVLSSFDPSEILHDIISLLYKHVGFDYLKVWMVIGNSLKDYIIEVKDISFLMHGSDSPNFLGVCNLFSYPFVACLYLQKRLTMVQDSLLQESCSISLQSQRKLDLELEHVIEVWKSLYVCFHGASYSENSTSTGFNDDLLLTLNGCLDKVIEMLERGPELNPRNTPCYPVLLLSGNVAICILEDMISAISSRGSIERDDVDRKQSSGISNSLEFIARFMTLSWIIPETNPPTSLAVISRVFSVLVHLIGCLHLKKDILAFFQIISSPLLHWLSSAELPREDTNQLQLLWTETLNCLQSSRSLITFDSSFLKLQAPLLERTLNHPNPSISEPTITYWNSTYAVQTKLDYPQTLLPVLDKLSRNGRINLCKRSSLDAAKCNPLMTASLRHRVSATHNMSSKRVELVEDKAIKHNKKQSSYLKRRRQELTEHQKDVRRAQQGRDRDCNGHGPGIRTYTTVDFSQGYEESQNSQETQDP